MAHLLIVDRLLEVDLKEIIMPHSKTIYETLVVFYAAACQRTSLASYEQHMAPKIWNPLLPESPLLTNCQFQLNAFMDTPDGIPN